MYSPSSQNGCREIGKRNWKKRSKKKRHSGKKKTYTEVPGKPSKFNQPPSRYTTACFFTWPFRTILYKVHWEFEANFR